MSFTLYRNRRTKGRSQPIRISFWDLLMPPRRPRSKVQGEASAALTSAPAASAPAGKSPARTAATKPTTAKAPTTTTTTTAHATTQPIGDVTKHGEDEAHTFTSTDDAKLLEMKASGKTWKEIVAELKKSQSVLKERFKEIGPKLNNSGGGVDKKKEAETEAPEDEKKAEDRTFDKKKGKGERETKKGATLAKKGNKAATSETTTKASKHLLRLSTTTSGTDPRQDPQILAKIAAKYDEDKWRHASSKYYDLTGKRISEKEAKKMALAGGNGSSA